MSTSSITTDLLLSAAIAAYRINDRQYIKEEHSTIYDQEKQTIVDNPNFKQKNSKIVKNLLKNNELISEDDRLNVEELKTIVQRTMMIRTLKEEPISDFDSKMLGIVSQLEVSEDCSAIAAYIPEFCARESRRQTAESLLINCHCDFVAPLAERIVSTIAVIQKNYSQKYSCYFVTAITDDNKRVFFAYSGKEELEVNKKYSIKATVKRHDANWVTVLNRVKPVKI